MTSRTGSLILAGLALIASTSAQTCYYPNGTAALPGVATPCNTGASNSHCCFPGDACLSNGYCFQQSQSVASWGMRIARGFCTDKTWDSPACPKYCADTFTEGTCTVLLTEDAPTGGYCCGGWSLNETTNLCHVATQGSQAPFNLPVGEVIYDRSTGATLIGTLNLTSNSTTSSTTTTITATITVAADKSNSVTTTAVGIAVPLAILLIAALGAIAYLWSRLRKTQQQLHDAAPAYSGAGTAAAMSTAGHGAHPMYSDKAPTYTSVPQFSPQFPPQDHHVNELNADPAISEVPGDTVPKTRG